MTAERVAEGQGTPDTTLRAQAMFFLFEAGFPVGEHEGAAIVERLHYGGAFLSFLHHKSADQPNDLLFGSARSKLNAMHIVRTSTNPSDRVDFRNWRAEVLNYAWVTAGQNDTVALAMKLEAAMCGTSAHEAAQDALVAMVVAAEEMDRLLSSYDELGEL